MVTAIDSGSRLTCAQKELARAVADAANAQRELEQTLDAVRDLARVLDKLGDRIQGAIDEANAALEEAPQRPACQVRHPRAGHSSDPRENPPEDARQLLAWLRRLSDQTGRDLMPIAQDVAHRAGAGSRVLGWPHAVIQDAARAAMRAADARR